MVINVVDVGAGRFQTMEGHEKSLWDSLGHGKPTKRFNKLEVSSERQCRGHLGAEQQCNS